MIKKKIKIGIIGFGSWGKKIFKRLKKNKRIEIIFIETTKKKYSKLYCEADWIYIATPFDTHFKIVRKFLLLKRNVFCEKPLSFNKNQLSSLYNLAKKNKITLFVNHIEFFKFKKKKIKIKKNNLIENYSKFNVGYEESFERFLYHDCYILHHMIKNKYFSFKLLNKKNTFELVFRQKSYTQKIRSSLMKHKNRVHNVNGINFVTKKDYINEYFNSIFSFKEDIDLNKKQVFFVSQIFNNFRKFTN
ncbi:Gfo/Idh/MocA family oxidoreductase [Candidatus Pelagibacter sp.]|nr:Gfo/Idh/MocA family oxidoreductase [Candidatus Pelagibacter sp.]